MGVATVNCRFGTAQGHADAYGEPDFGAVVLAEECHKPGSGFIGLSKVCLGLGAILPYALRSLGAGLVDL